jgi:hypothetical protein
VESKHWFVAKFLTKTQWRREAKSSAPTCVHTLFWHKNSSPPSQIEPVISESSLALCSQVHPNVRHHFLFCIFNGSVFPNHYTYRLYSIFTKLMCVDVGIQTSCVWESVERGWVCYLYCMSCSSFGFLCIQIIAKSKTDTYK